MASNCDSVLGVNTVSYINSLSALFLFRYREIPAFCLHNILIGYLDGFWITRGTDVSNYQNLKTIINRRILKTIMVKTLYITRFEYFGYAFSQTTREYHNFDEFPCRTLLLFPIDFT